MIILSATRFEIVENAPPFKIKNNRFLFSMKSLDRENKASYDVPIMAKDNGNVSLRSISVMRIEVMDENDNAPIIVVRNNSVSVQENMPAFTKIATVEVFDKDIGQNANVSFFLIGRQQILPFQIMNNTDIVTNRPLDKEKESFYNMMIIAEDKGNPSLTSYAEISVTILDENDHHPLISLLEGAIYTSVFENSPPGTLVTKLKIKDFDSGKNGNVTVFVTSPDVPFALKENINIVTTKQLDRDTIPWYDLQLMAKDDGSPPKNSSVIIRIYIEDENDNDPQLLYNNTHFVVKENEAPGTIVTKLETFDADIGRNAIVDVRMDREATPAFTVKNNEFLITEFPLDREACDLYDVALVLSDRGEIPRTVTVTVQVTVIDVNDNPPIFGFNKNVLNISEDVPVGMVLLDAGLTDADAGKNGEISLRLGQSIKHLPFEIQDNRYLKTQRELDREEEPNYKIELIANDEGDEPFTVKREITINLMDVNDDDPEFIFPSDENRIVNASMADTGSEIARLEAIDNDAGANSQLEYILKNYRETFSLARSGSLIMSKKPTDQEFELEVEVRDGGTPRRKTTGKLIVNIGDFYEKPVSAASGRRNRSQNMSPSFFLYLSVGIFQAWLLFKAYA